MTEWNELEQRLKRHLKCEVNFGAAAKALYATDSSNYHQVPIGVVVPKTDQDIKTTIDICHSLQAPVLLRGGGTALAGQTCNAAVVMDTSKYYHHLLHIDPVRKRARVQPGIVLDDVRNEAEKYNLTFGPDPATHNRCTLGGMIGNNSCGVHSVMAGKTVDNIESLRIVTYDGVEMTVGATSDEEYAEILRQGGRRAEIYRALRELRDHYAPLIRERYPHIPRRVSGYNLDQLLPENGFNVARALVGSEGTCVTVLEATLKLVESPQARALAVLGFINLECAAHAIPSILKHHPIGLEGMDETLVENMKTKHIHPDSIHALPEGKAWLLAEFGSDTQEENHHKITKLERDVRHLHGFQEVKPLFDKEEQKKLWEVRESGLGATAYVPGQPDTWEGWEDSAVPPEKVGDYLSDLKKLYQKYDYHGALYGHFGQGCVHTRINFDLQTEPGIEKYHQFISEAADLVVSYGGSLSGEHGDGQSKAEFLPKMFGPELVEAFQKFKSIWDPMNKMNPGKVVYPYSNTQNLRLGASYSPAEPATYFKYPQDGGSFAHATLRCVGVGLCRRHDGGVMCPSYMVTREEKHATRGRAHLLFEMLRGETITDGWNSPEVKSALDLCLACKGCKGECPTNVDMATYKAEFLAHYYKKHWRPPEAHSMGQIYRWCRIAQWVPWLVNFFTQTPGFSWMAKKIAGIHPQRKIPQFAGKSFLRRHRKEDLPKNSGRPQVYLWVDTFNNAFHPQVAEAAVRVLRKAGFDVLLPKKSHCCGRPLYDFGFLDQARELLMKVLNDFRPQIRSGLYFVFLEPSCASVFREELVNLFPTDQDALRMSKQCLMLSEFLVQHAPNFQWPKVAQEALVQGHCHHKSVLNFDEEKSALMKLGLDFDVLDSGCCGMAGSFGFAEKHYPISKAVGERVLLKKVREADGKTLIIADGFSCREQIRQETGREVKHLAEVLDQL